MSRARRLAALCFAGVLAQLAPSAARGDEYHHQNILLGERAMSMGGAYAALGHSPESIFYNPAGLGFVQGTRLSLQTGVYGLASDTTGGGGGFVATDSSQLLSFPSTTSIARRLAPEHVVAFAILTPDYDFRATQLLARNVPGTRADGSPVTLDSISLLQDDRDTTLLFGPGYAWRPHRRFALGASLFFSLRDRSILSKFGAVLGGQVARSIEVSAKLLHLGLLGIVGVRAEPVDGLFLGASFRTPSARLASSAEGSVTRIENGVADRTLPELTGAQSKLPWRATFGVAYERPRTFALAADVTIVGGVAPYGAIEGSGFDADAAYIDKRLVANANVGAEVWLGGYVALRAGFFTNFSARGAPSDNVREQQVYGVSGVVGGQGDPPDLYGVTFGVGLEGARTSISLAFNYAFGEGQSVLASATAPRPIRLLLFGIAGSYAF